MRTLDIFNEDAKNRKTLIWQFCASNIKQPITEILFRFVLSMFERVFVARQGGMWRLHPLHQPFLTMLLMNTIFPHFETFLNFDNA